MRKTRLLCSVAIAGAFLCMPVSNRAQTDHDQRRLDRFTGALLRDGYIVTPGAPIVWNLADAWCKNTPGVPHAGWSNNAPYVFLAVPKSAEEPGTLVSDFQISRDEAIVLVGTTPPPEKYFAFYTFVAKKVYPNGEKREILNSAVDPVNNATIKTAGATPFNAQVALIFTADQDTDARVRAALQRAGYPASIINTVVLPASMLSLGYGDSGDEFRIPMRNAVWLEGHEDAGNSYIANSADTLHIFRVTPQRPCSGGGCKPLPMPALRVRGTGQTELYLWNKMAELRNGIIASNPGLHPTDLPIIPAIGYEGYDNMQRGEWEGGDARDAFVLEGGYLPEFGTRQVITLADGEFLMAFGANHVATGKATYMSINVYTSEEKDGKLSIGTVYDGKFVGTATAYLPHGDPDASVMYAYKISRSCGGEVNCLEVPSADLDETHCPRLTVGPDTVLGLIFRMYLEPATKIGAAMPEVLYDRLIKFSPRPPAGQ